MHSNKFSSTTFKKVINTSKTKKSNVKKLPFRKTFIDPLTPKLSECSRLVLWSTKSLSAKKLNNVFLNSRELKNVSTGKFSLFSNSFLQKSSLPCAKVIGCTDYSDRRNVFSYYGFYTPHLSSNFDLR
jgi:hypothetical protein